MSIDPLIPLGKNKLDRHKVSKNDPMQTMRAEFDVHGKGLTGKYRKNRITRFGFILLSIPFFGFGFGFLGQIFQSGINVASLYPLLWAAVCLLSGYKLLTSALKK